MNNTALIVIDVINDFIFNKECPLYCLEGEAKLNNITDAIDFFHQNENQVVFVKDAHRKNDGDFLVRPLHGLKGTWGGEIAEPVKEKMNEFDYLIEKRRFSGFSYTDLDLFLREELIENLVLIGGWTNTGIRSTASDAFHQGYKLTVLDDCCFSQTEDTHLKSLRDMKIFGEMMPLEKYKELQPNKLK